MPSPPYTYYQQTTPQTEFGNLVRQTVRNTENEMGQTSFSPVVYTEGQVVDLSPALVADGGNWVPESGITASTETSNTIGGTAIRLQNPTSSNMGVRYDLPQPIEVGTPTSELYVSVWFWCDFAPVSGTSQIIRIYLYSDGGNGRSIEVNMAQGMRTGWNCVRLPTLDTTGVTPGRRSGAGAASPTCWISNSGGYNPALGIYRIRVYLQDATQQGTFPLQFAGITIGYRPVKPLVVLGNDDGHDGMFEELFDRGDGLGAISTVERARILNVPLSVGVIRDAVDQPGYLTGAQLQSIASSGNFVHTHGGDDLSSSNFSTELLAYSDGSPVPPFVEGDSASYNADYIRSNFGAENAKYHVMPRNAIRNSGESWQKALAALMDDSFNFTTSNAPGFQNCDPVGLSGDADAGWYCVGRMGIESGSSNLEIPTYNNLINNTIDGGIIKDGQHCWLYFHDIIPGAGGGAPPTTSAQYYVGDMANLLHELADRRDQGLIDLVTAEGFYKRLLATGVPAGMSYGA